MATTIKSRWWSITAYNDELTLLERVMKGEEECPPYIKKLYGGREECPKTGRHHFQGCVNTDEIRMSQLKKWLPTSHLEKAQKKEALIKYVMKEDTAVGDKKEIENKIYCTYELLLWQLIEYIYKNTPCQELDAFSKKNFQRYVNDWYEADYNNVRHKIGMLSDPKFFRMYQMFGRRTFEIYKHQQQYTKYEEVEEED